MSKQQWTYRQSDFGTFSACPEQLRRKIYDPLPQLTNSDQTRGNICHAVFEDIGQRVLDGYIPLMDDVNSVAAWHVARMFPTVDVWNSPKERIEAAVYANVEGWFHDILPKLALTAVEEQFLSGRKATVSLVVRTGLIRGGIFSRMFTPGWRHIRIMILIRCGSFIVSRLLRVSITG